MHSKYDFISVPYRIDRKLYKYYSNVKYAIDCISKDRIHLDPPSSFNDPFDGAYNCWKYSILSTTLSGRAFVDRVIEYLRHVPEKEQKAGHFNMLGLLMNHRFQENDKETSRTVNDRLEALYNTFSPPPMSFNDFRDEVDIGFFEDQRVIHLDCKVSCFSEIWDSILMWSYYGNKHEGVCIEFDLSQLNPTDAFNAEILKNFSRVHYSPVRADVQASLDDSTIFNFLTTKADVWGHEHEWRIICDTEEDFLLFPCISNVFLGARFDMRAPKYDALIKAVSKHEGLSIQRCKLSPDKYQLECETVYDSAIMSAINKLRAKQSDVVA